MPKVSPDYVEARREQILAGARRCFARWGYEGATVPRLVEAIGLSHGAIFNYYPSKLDLFFDLAVRDHDRLERVWEEEGFAALVRVVAAEDPDWLAVYLEFNRLLRTEPKLASRWRRSARSSDRSRPEWLDRERDAGRIRSDVPRETLFVFLHTLVDGLALLRTSGAKIDVEPLIEFVAGALAPPRRRS